MHGTIYYTGLVAFILGFIVIFLSIYKMSKDKVVCIKNEEKTLDLQAFFRKNVVLASIGIALTVAGFILLDYAFFIEDATQEIIAGLESGLQSGHLFLSYFFGILTILSIDLFIYSFYFYYYIDKEKLSAKVLKIRKIIFYCSIPLMIICFFAFMEGNAPYFTYPLANVIHFGSDGVYLTNIYNNSSIGGVNIYLYAVFILSGAIIVYFICNHLTYKYYGEHSLLFTCFIIAFPMGIIGARLWYVVLDITKNGATSTFMQDWTNIFNFSSGGLGIMGGAILGIISGVSVVLIQKYAMKKEPYTRINYLHMVDYIVPAILIAQAVGRWGNFFNNEVYGNAVSTTYWSWLPTFVKNNMTYGNHGNYGNLGEGYIFLPLFFIECISNLVGYFFIYFLFSKGYLYRWIKMLQLKIKGEDYKNYDYNNLKAYVPFGSAIGMYLVWYGLTRTILEPMRYSNYQYNTSQITSYVFTGAGVVIIALAIIFKIFVTDKGYPNIILKDKKLVVETAGEGSVKGIENSKEAIKEPITETKEDTKEEKKE